MKALSTFWIALSLSLPLVHSISIPFQHKIKYHNFINIIITTLFCSNYIISWSIYKFQVLHVPKLNRSDFESWFCTNPLEKLESLIIFKVFWFINFVILSTNIWWHYVLRDRKIMRKNSFKFNISMLLL